MEGDRGCVDVGEPGVRGYVDIGEPGEREFGSVVSGETIGKKDSCNHHPEIVNDEK